MPQPRLHFACIGYARPTDAAGASATDDGGIAITLAKNKHASSPVIHGFFICNAFGHQYQTLHFPIRIAEMFPMTPKTLKSQMITAITTTTFKILFMVACIGM
jgi:hypothetical protein